MMNKDLLSFNHKNGLVRRWLRLIEGDAGLLYLNGFTRIVILIALVLYFVYRRSDFGNSELWIIKLALLLFFFYNIIIGFLGVLHPEWFLHTIVKITQISFEIILYSWFYLLTKDPHADIFFLYFAPLFFAVHFLNFSQALWIIVFGGINLFLVLCGLSNILHLRASWFELNNPLAQVFWPRLLLLLALSFAYAIRRRISIPSMLQEDDTAFSDLFQSLDDGIFIIDKQHKLVYVNEALQDRHGTFRIGEPAPEYFHCQEQLFDLKTSASINPPNIRSLYTQNGEFIDQEGATYQVEISLIPLSDEAEKSRELLGIVKDKDRPQKLEKDLKLQIYRYGERVQSLISQRALWQETYVELGKRLSGIDDPMELMNFAVQETRKRLKVETSSIFLLEGNILYRKAIAGVEPDWLKDECYQLGDGITGQAIQTGPDSKFGQVIRRNQVNQDPQVVTKYLLAYQDRLKTHQVNHLMAVPLNGQSKSFGVLRVVNKIDDSGRIIQDGFNEEDQDFLVTISAMVAIALENNRFYKQEQERRMLSDTVLEVSRKINTNLNLTRMLPDIIVELDKVLPNCSISIQELEGKHLKIIACKGFENRSKVTRLEFPIDDPKYPNHEVMESKLPLRIDDVRQSFPHFLEEANKYASEHIRSWMGIPLIYRDRIIGMITFDHSEPGFYTKDLETVAVTFANQIAIAIANAQLFREQKSQMKNLDRLLQASQVVASSINLDDVLQKIVEMANKVSGSDHTGVLLINEDGELGQSFESSPLGHPLYLRTRPEGVTHKIIETRRPIFFNKVIPNDRRHNPVILQAGFRSYGGLPIVASEKILGVLFIHSYKANCYNDRKIIPLLETLCNQAAIAVENALLYERVAKQANMLKSLVEASIGLIQHTSLDELIKYCAQKAANIFEVEDCSVYLHNSERNTVDLVYSTGIPPKIWEKREIKLTDPGLTAFVAREGEILNFGGDEYKNHPAWAGHFAPPFTDHLLYLPSQDCLSLLIVPIQDSQENIVGILKLENRKGIAKEHRFNEFEVDMQKTFASHIGTAVERARLYEQLDKEARKEAREALSYDLHDISNMIHGALILRLEVAREKLARDMFLELDKELLNISKAAQSVHSLLRWIHYDLRGDDVLHEKGLIPALEHIGSLYKIQLETQVTGRTQLPIDIEYSLYKIGLEALVNSAKHGGANILVKIRLIKDKTKFTFEVEDNGYGFDQVRVLKQSYTFGLNSMRRWADLMDAEIKFQSELESGTTVTVSGRIPQTGESK